MQELFQELGGVDIVAVLVPGDDVPGARAAQVEFEHVLCRADLADHDAQHATRRARSLLRVCPLEDVQVPSL